MLPAIYLSLFLPLLPIAINARVITLTTINSDNTIAINTNTTNAAVADVPAGPAGPLLVTKATRCGSRGMARCSTGHSCIADPSNLACSLIADCPGLCAKLDGKSCSGPDDTSCPAGQTCVDKPGDSCNPQLGGENCPSICVFLDGRSAAEAV